MSTATASPRAEFLSIKDAALRYQKAEITIRRFVRSVLQKEKNADRAFVHPLPQDAQKFKKSKKPFAYTIAQELLEKHFGAEASENIPRRAPAAQNPYLNLLEKTNGDLRSQLDVKDEQIRVLSQAIDGLSERQRETNILMKGLQETLLLSAPKHEVVEAAVAEPEGRKRKRWLGIF